LEVRDIFQSPTIAELALEIKLLKRAIDQDVVEGDVPLTPIQSWFFAQSSPALHHFNQSVLLKSTARLNADRLRTVFEMLQIHHDALRLRYQIAEVLLGYNNLKGLVVRQENAGIAYPVNFQTIDLTQESNPATKVESYANALHESFHLGQGPLMKAILFHLPQEDQLFIVIHHLVVDTVSWRILLEDLMTAYTQATLGNVIKLPLKTDAFKHYAEKLSEHAQTDAVLQEIPYWQAVESTLVRSLPRDFDTPDNCIADTAYLTLTLPPVETQILLADAHHAYHTRIDDLLLTALALALKQWHSGNKTLIMLEKYGREVLDLNLSRTVGWFTSIYPLVLELPETDNLGYQIKFIKESLRKVPNLGLNYGTLKYLASPEQRIGLNLQDNMVPLSFNYLGQLGDAESESSIFTVDWDSVGQGMSPQTPRAHDVDILSWVYDGKLEISINYHQQRYQPATIQRLATAYQHALHTVIAHCHSQQGSELTPDDLTYKGLSLEDLDNLFA
jgi:non-ribosomal peptide synthase protein (TIGR01720 family)